MKYLKYLLYLIIVVALIFFGKGLLTPSVSYDSEVFVDKSIEEAWAVMSDELKMPEWIEGFKRIEPVSGTPNTVGAVSKIYIEDGGQEMMMEETITAIKPNEHLAMTFTMDFMNMDYEMFLKEKDGKTHITTKSNTVGNGIVARSILAFMGGSMKNQEEENLSKLKKVIEENTTNYFPKEKQNSPAEERSSKE